MLVSSGAVGAGAARLGLASRPSDLAAKQALAAIGQVHLMRHYDDFLSALRLTCAQVLLTLDNLAVRSQWRAAASTFEALFAAGGVVPVVNENDTVAVAELRIGDNDTLSAQVATLVRADWLFLMTDVDALYTANPAADPKAARVAEVHDLSALAVNTTGEADGGGASASASASRGGGGGGGGGGGDGKDAAASAPSSSSSASDPASTPPVPPPAAGAAAGGAGTQWGTGGMATKLTAARIATAAGCSVAVLHAARPETIRAVIAGDPSAGGTVFHAIPHPSRGRKRWITSVPVKGRLLLDAGAVRAVRERGASLFAAGVVGLEGGEFDAQEAVLLVASADGGEIARGLVNYSSGEVRALVAAARRGGGAGSGNGGGNWASTSGDNGGSAGGRSGSGSGGRDHGGNNHSGSGSGGGHSAEAVLGYHGPDELVHRDNIVMLAPRAPTPTPAVMRAPPSSSGSPSAASTSAAAAAALAAGAAAAAAAAEAAPAASPLSAEERLRQIRERDGGGGGRPRVSFDPLSATSAADNDDGGDDGVMHAAAEAAAVEAAAELAAASLGGGGGKADGSCGEDIDERGWLPK